MVQDARSLKIRRVKITELHADPANARTHGERNLNAIEDSLKSFGQVEPLVVQKSTGKVIGGNGRLEVMRRAGIEECDVVEVDVDDAKATALGIALNRTAELAEWDDEVLTKLLEALPSELLEVSGFNSDDLQELIAELHPPEITQDDIPAPPDSAATRPGDLWLLGDHRLICGDSSMAADVDRLLAGAPIHMVNTDPPYNVAVEPRSNNAIAAGLSSFPSGQKMHLNAFDLARDPSKAKGTTAKLRAKDRPLANDAVTPQEFDALLAAWYGNAARVLLPGRAFYIWGGYGNLKNYPAALEAAGLYFAQAIIWDKQHPVLGRKDFMNAHEWAYYGWREGAAHVFLGPNNIPDLWQVKKLNHTQMVHLTEKPVELAARAMQYSSRKGEHVLDLFGGSGSTLMAAEQMGRKAFLVELDPLYCDVIVQRWQNATGRKATLEGDGRTWDEVRAERETANPVTANADESATEPPSVGSGGSRKRETPAGAGVGGKA